VLSRLARLILKAGGWTIVGDIPKVDKAVLIAAPHTSNWDGIWGMVYRVAAKLDVHFFAKRSLFWFPLGPILRLLGGVPLDRDRAGGAVQQAVDLFDANETMIFGLSPEGTRKHTGYWKTGFYRIAVAADVPIILGHFDYAKREIGITRLLPLTGDRDADLDAIREYYASHGSARHPEKVGPIRFRDDPPPGGTPS
jgi:1-acyl-sn-glycerol-3-phosphate acyltransferase